MCADQGTQEDALVRPLLLGDTEKLLAPFNVYQGYEEDRNACIGHVKNA